MSERSLPQGGAGPTTDSAEDLFLAYDRHYDGCSQCQTQERWLATDRHDCPEGARLRAAWLEAEQSWTAPAAI